MRFLILHVNSFCCTITEKGRSKVYETYDDPVTRVEEALIVLASAERGDERAPHEVARRASTEIVKLATQLKVATVVLHPFAHLFAELSAPEVAIDVLSRTQQELITAGLHCLRTPFGWFNTLQIDAKGHPLSRVARIVTVEEERKAGAGSREAEGGKRH
jgi:threonyl-tRNA synthetase